MRPTQLHEQRINRFLRHFFGFIVVTDRLVVAEDNAGLEGNSRNDGNRRFGLLYVDAWRREWAEFFVPDRVANRLRNQRFHGLFDEVLFSDEVLKYRPGSFAFAKTRNVDPLGNAPNRSVHVLAQKFILDLQP